MNCIEEKTEAYSLGDNTMYKDSSAFRSKDTGSEACDVVPTKVKKTRRGKKRKAGRNEENISVDIPKNCTVFACMFCGAKLFVEDDSTGQSPRDVESDILKICKECNSLFPGTHSSEKLQLRPKLNVLPPVNSTEFLMEQEASLYSLDFTPKKLRLSEDDRLSPDSLYDGSCDLYLNNDSEFENFLKSQFEIDFGVCREEQLNELPKDELVSKFIYLKSHVDSLQSQLAGKSNDSYPIEICQVIEERDILLKENEKLKDQNR